MTATTAPAGSRLRLAIPPEDRLRSSRSNGAAKSPASTREAHPSIRRERTAARRRAILEAALKCFAAIGFDKTTLLDIRAEARASIGSIYHHFKGKEQLAGALYLEGLRDYHQNLLEELRPGRNAASLIRGLVRCHLLWVKANPEWARYLFEYRHLESVVAVESAIRERNATFFREAFSRLRPYFDEGKIEPISREIFVAILIGPSQLFARNWLVHRRKHSLEDAIRELGEAAWQSLKPRKVRNP